MLCHKFHAGETVYFLPDRPDMPGGVYTIERLLPIEGPVVWYHVKNMRDGRQRVVRENQLTQVPS